MPMSKPPRRVFVKRGHATITVSKPEDLLPDDVIRVGGGEMTVRAARRYGVLADAFALSPDQLDPGL